jgi:hypothetical protein
MHVCPPDASLTLRSALLPFGVGNRFTISWPLESVSEYQNHDLLLIQTVQEITSWPVSRFLGIIRLHSDRTEVLCVDTHLSSQRGLCRSQCMVACTATSKPPVAGLARHLEGVQGTPFHVFSERITAIASIK